MILSASTTERCNAHFAPKETPAGGRESLQLEVCLFFPSGDPIHLNFLNAELETEQRVRTVAVKETFVLHRRPEGRCVYLSIDRVSH